VDPPWRIGALAAGLAVLSAHRRCHGAGRSPRDRPDAPPG
jgi:hypothetical protein